MFQYTLVADGFFRYVPADRISIKALVHHRVSDRVCAVIWQQVLFRDVSNVLGFFVLCVEVIKRLVFVWPDVLGDGVVPFVGIGKDRIYVKDNPSERIHSMLDGLSDGELCRANH